MNAFNIYLTGVGGQGIGLISETILRAADHAGHAVKSVDTHGLAQRGGIVVSHIRLGEKIFSPLVPDGQADLAIALERHEALRAAATMLKAKGALVYYDTVWQPLSVRLNQASETRAAEIERFSEKRGIRVVSVFQADLPDIRMQNMVVLAEICRRQLIPGIDLIHYRAAMDDLMAGAMLEKNSAVFDK
ncbi:indolepyruvate oxidoreductase [Desulfosarcina ovata subsp. sediminis]|uniref:Indolepyruvate oxidoreductase n=1 Tax=Desulfosarcina ovata subsp. sediminis TaxID=885957 RepID=A0A5K7ZM09_9BACT|nr:2-oxoacid:acceptor oxidoreductase family protein [Desulfosarcina ovata]BBO81375.1 indolepyruvate oxidoreductase [Desulfosarcina ovata subsp. sediminis]